MVIELPTPPPIPERSSHVRRRVEQIATFVNSSEAHELLSSGTMNPMRAMVIRAVMATPGLPRFLQEQVSAPGYRRAGYDILGIGYHAITVSDGDDSVRKYYRRTAGTSEAHQTATIEAWDKKQSLVLEHLGAYAVPQVFSIEENPLNSDESIVTARQDRIEASRTINIFQPFDIPGSARQFLEDSQTMQSFSEPSALPDLLGRDNALLDMKTGGVKLVDPIPLVRGDSIDDPGYDKVSNFLETYLGTSSK